jgi:hypothetical protein
VLSLQLGAMPGLLFANLNIIGFVIGFMLMIAIHVYGDGLI